MSQQPPDLVKKGQFYFIYDRPPYIVMEDKTKRGLEVHDHVLDEKYGVEADRGMIHDMDGIGHKVGIRWYFPRAQFTVEQVVELAEDMERRYRAIRELTCPDDE
ncbi:MAG: hypothetical protein ACREAY_01120 [Nitrososphaera sp.]|uniref:hypothetical protein n=1 Tax=Nitrososphaera sp. TaxID=1971748 RepID=UPI003D6FC600